MNLKSVCGIFLVAGVASLLLADTTMAQGRMGRGGMMGMMGGNNLGLLNSEKVQRELELVDDQIDELKQIQQDAVQVMRDMFSEIQDLPRDQMRDAMRGLQEKMQGRMKTFAEQADEVLLPHQRERLKQLSYQSSGRGRGAGSALQNEELMDELGITDEQKEKLEEAREKAQKELEKKYAKLVAEAEEEILKVLDSDQRKKYRELVGENFQFEERGGFNPGRRGGDRGGREGRRGNRQRSDF